MAVHVPVLLDEVMDLLQPAPGGVLLDGTLGLGGHALVWLRATAKAGETGRVVGCDRDAEALTAATERLEAEFPGALHAHHGSYEEASQAVADSGVAAVDAALMDLGVSSLQLDAGGRGFSLRTQGPLDMRMDASSGRTAADLVNESPEHELADLIARFGEEPKARRVARAIVLERRRAPFRDTLRLAECVANALGGRRGRLHPATRTFQGIRIALNDELGRLERGLPAVAACLRPGGHMGVITFHRLEDAPTKRFFREGVSDGTFAAEPDRTPSRAEIGRNPRSRSARLRGACIAAQTSSNRASTSTNAASAKRDVAAETEIVEGDAR